jgi:hypothetical protein
MQESGLLQGRVIKVQPEPQVSITSLAARLRLCYDSSARGERPDYLFIKMRRNEQGNNFDTICQAEVSFYRLVAKHVSTCKKINLLQCYHTELDKETGSFHILLQDIGDTHEMITEWPVPPKLPDCYHAIESLACLHAYFWDHPELDMLHKCQPHPQPDHNVIIQTTKQFLDYLDDRISTERRHLYEKIVYALPNIFAKRIAERPAGKPGLTLTHGDAHFWNFMFPKNRNKEPIYLIDWQSFAVEIAMFDIAYMMAFHWFPERRSRFEDQLLSRYHSMIVEQGVGNYSLDECYLDYRRSALVMVLIPAFQWISRSPASIWWPHLERAFLAIDDMDCLELLAD